MGACRGSKVKTYTDGYLDALLDIQVEIRDSRNPMYYDNKKIDIKKLDILLGEMIQDLRSL
jgi:hypothetical protein